MYGHLNIKMSRNQVGVAEVADAVAYLVSPSAGSLTGHVLMLDGGLTIY